MEKERIEKTIAEYNLFKTFLEGVDYIAQGGNTDSIYNDLCDALQILMQFVKYELKPNRELEKYFSTMKKILNEEVQKPTDVLYLEKTVCKLKDIFISAIISGIQEETEKVVSLKSDMGHTIFDFCDSIGWEVPRMKGFVFQLCAITDCTCPKESYDHMMQLIRKYPKEFGGEKAVHPEYVYEEHGQRTFEECTVCGSQGIPFYSAFSYRMVNFGNPHRPVKLWMKCENCGNLYTWKFPEEFLALSNSSKIVQPDREQYLTTIEDQVSSLSVWSGILNELDSYSKGRSLLEVGIGRGELLAVALEMMYEPDAVEIVEEDAQRVANLLDIPIWNGDFLNYLPDKKYSKIIMGDVIEHVTQPIKALERAYELLEDDGVLWLSTPNFESSFSKMRKFTDAMWKEPYHITYFSYKPFEKMAEKCGFEIRKYSVSSRYNGSMELILTKKQ